jgi:hypothetical protein
MNRRFQVQVENKATQDFDTADEALRWAMGHVYLSPIRFEDGKDLLNSGRVFSYCYGFAGVDIVPIEI